MKKESINKLSQNNILFLYEYLFQYTNLYEKSYGNFNWNDDTISTYCKHNHIEKKGRKGKKYDNDFFWFETQSIKGKGNDIAFHFLRHIRNAFAHANIRKERRKNKSYFIIDDYNKKNKQTMHGEIKENLFFQLLEIIINTLNK